jgi:hypothetical protein
MPETETATDSTINPLAIILSFATAFVFTSALGVGLAFVIYKHRWHANNYAVRRIDDQATVGEIEDMVRAIEIVTCSRRAEETKSGGVVSGIKSHSFLTKEVDILNRQRDVRTFLQSCLCDPC